MLVTASRTTASVAHKTAFPAFSSAAASSTVLRSTGLPRFVVRQRRHSSSNKHSSTSKQQQSAPVTSTPKQEGQQQQQQQQQPTRKRGERALKKTASANANGQAKEAKGGQGQDGQHQHKSAESIVTDVKAQLDSVATMPPSVPSTSHYDPKIVHLASLFAQHRPISLNQPLPPVDAKSAFENIFAHAPVSGKKRSQDVIFTLASAVKSLENATSGGSPNGVKIVTPSPFESSQQQNPVINLEELGKQFRPFQTPPPPMPLDPKYMQQERAFEQEVTEKTKKKASKAAAAAESVDVAPAMSEPKRIITVHREKTIARRKMQLISVKRQRKLKMKKHKYKKLMKRTRNLRRRQDRL